MPGKVPLRVVGNALLDESTGAGNQWCKTLLQKVKLPQKNFYFLKQGGATFGIQYKITNQETISQAIFPKDKKEDLFCIFSLKWPLIGSELVTESQQLIKTFKNTKLLKRICIKQQQNHALMNYLDGYVKTQPFTIISCIEFSIQIKAF